MIPYGRQDITQDDVNAVLEVLQSNYLTQGPTVPRFELSIANYVSVNNAVALSSATSALHISCLALGLGPNDYLWTAPITFVASANCALYCGAKVDFVDIDERTYLLCPEKLETKLIQAANCGKLPKIVVAVHLCGQSCQMEKIFELGKKYGFKIIEDASHAIGGKYQDDLIGSCRYSDVTVFSFHPVKIITTAEGGMALTNSNDLAVKMTLLRSHGITRDTKLMTHSPDGPWYYQQLLLGYNYRMSDIQAALGLSQLNRLSYYVMRRHQIARRYDELLQGLPIIAPWQYPKNYSAFHLYVIQLKLEELSKSRNQIFKELQNFGIGVNVHYIPVHMQPYYQAMGFRLGDFPQSEKYYSSALTLPIFPTMTSEQQNEIVDKLRKVLLS